ncbi:unnamed protein product [Mycena citricolor]|uniref:squalene synthase n=1 Tax=Mycena citricolor TaxID=2018698 RepID=A0AAD2H4E4_9AGAR|nr:unnamed protein product [Mycena citricolor]
MGVSTYLLLLLTHPLEFRTLLQYKIWYEQKRDITAQREHITSGWDRASMRRCWDFLDMTSRSFSSVIKELDGDMARAVCLFYLVLRALDTIEDDMTIPASVKEPLLLDFYKRREAYDGSGPKEKDRQLLVEYDVVVEELDHLDAPYRDAILSIARKMGMGMADFIAREANEKADPYLDSIADFDLYCHYVAGLVGEGLSALFSASGKESPTIKDQLELSNSMGLLLQKTNIIRDYREDVDDKRYFWPRAIWGDEKYGGGFSTMEEMRAPPPGTVWDSATQQRALWVQSAMVLTSLRHATDALDYLRMLKNQSIFNFCAIPAVMALATLDLCFMNPRMFQTNIKIRKAEAAGLIMRATNPREVSIIFREYARKIHGRALPSDPNYLRLSVACGKIEQWCEHHYPSFVVLSGGGGSTTQSINADDARGRTFNQYKKADEVRDTKLRVERLRAELGTGASTRQPPVQAALPELLIRPLYLSKSPSTHPMSLAPPFTAATALQKVKNAQNLWNTCDPVKVALAYTPDTIWRNRTSFVQGREQVEQFLTEKWAKEHRYVLRKELFAFQDNRIAVQFFYEWNERSDGTGQWHRTYGLEDWTFDPSGLMRKRMMSGNDLAISDEERWFKDGVDIESVDISEKHL